MPVFLKKPPQTAPQPFVVTKVPQPPEPKPVPVVATQRKPTRVFSTPPVITNKQELQKRINKRREELERAEIYPPGEVGAFFKWLDSRDLVICAWNAIGYSPYRGTKRLIQEFQGKIGPLDSEDWHGFGGEEVGVND